MADIFQQTINKCKGKVYTDNDFKANKNGLINNWDDPSDEIQSLVPIWKTYKWQRTTDIKSLNDDEGELSIFFEDIEPTDIQQGALGNCYFLSAISVLTEHPQRVRKMIVSDKINREGVFGVKMFKNGQEQTVVLDNYVPCEAQGDPCFSKANGNELWVLLLEKAWAKLHGSYERIIGGQAHLTLRDLTGAPSFEFETSDPEAFARILEGEHLNYAMAAGINPLDSNQAQKIKDLGLITEHSYGLIAAAEVTDKNGKPAKLVQMRNPWGNFEWQGDWGDNSDCWTPELKLQLDLKEDADDGTFWMSFTDMQKYFGRFQVAKINDNYSFSNFEVTQKPDSFSLLKLKVAGTGEHTLSVSQQGERMFDRDSNYKYANCRMILLKWKNDNNANAGFEYVCGSKGVEDRDAYIELKKLERGTYYFYIEMEWPANHCLSTFQATSYGHSQVTFQSDESKSMTKEQALEMAFRAKASQADEFEDVKVSDMGAEGARKVKKYTCSKQAEGYNWVLVVNEEDDATLVEEHSFQKFENIAMVAPEQGSAFKIEVGPGESQCVMMRGSLAGYSIRQNYTSQIFWGEASLIKQVVAQGEKKIRHEDGITQYSMQHTGGIFFYYKNQTSDKTLKEEINFDISGLKIEGEDSQEVKFDVKPMSQKVLKLVATGGAWTFGCKCAYGVK